MIWYKVIRVNDNLTRYRLQHGEATTAMRNDRRIGCVALIIVLSELRRDVG